METTSKRGRVASGPEYGAGRDAFFTGLFSWLTAFAATKVTSVSGDPALGEIAAQGVQAYGPAAVGGTAAAVVGAFTYARKKFFNGD